MRSGDGALSQLPEPGKAAKGRIEQTVANWPTPTTRDHKGGGDAMVRADGKIRNDMLDWVAEKWPTPRAHESGQYTRDNGDPESQRETLTGAAISSSFLYSVHLPEPSPNGSASSKERRSLNPLFVEWLMGWPPAWTLLAWTDFACSETAFCLWRQRMRSALSQLASPTAAPPAQLGLFG